MKNKIFNIAFIKSGSKSLTHAMRLLGYNSVHYTIEGERLLYIVQENQENARKLLFGIDNYDFYSDFSGFLFFRQLYEEYPDSKFIVTIREIDSWVDSYRRQKEKKGDLNFLNKKAVEMFHRIQNDIADFFKDKQEKVLYINICDGEGWEKLCPFLGVDIPENVEFPAANKYLPGNIRDENYIERFIHKNLKILQSKKILLYGYSEIGKLTEKILEKNNISISGFYDKNAELSQDKRFIDIEMINNNESFLILICSRGSVDEIILNLNIMNKRNYMRVY